MKRTIIWATIITFILVLSAGSFFLYRWLDKGAADKPSIMILQPQSPQTIQNNQGILFVISARSKQGIHRIEFFENGIPRKISHAPGPGQPELVSQIAWLPESVGTYNLKWVAFDLQNNPSDPVSMTIGVTSHGLSRVESAEIRAKAESSEIVLVAGSGFDGQQNGTEGQPEGSANPLQESADIQGGGAAQQDQPQDAEEESQPDQPQIEEQEAQPEQQLPENEEMIQEAQDEPPGADVGLPIQNDLPNGDDGGGEEEEAQPEVSDLPPEIVSFNTSLQREGNGVRLIVDVTAQDDVGLFYIFIIDYADDDQLIPIQLEHTCDGQVFCAASASEVLGPGVHNIVAGASDTIEQLSRLYFKNIEINENLEVDEGPVVIERPDPEEIPWEFILEIAQLPGSIIQMQPIQPVEVIGVQQGINAEDRSCEPHSIFDAQIEIEQFWREDHTPYFRLDCFFPCQIQTDSDDATICVEADEIGLNCSYEDWDMLCRAHISWLQDQPYDVYEIRTMYGPDRPWTRELCGMGNVTFTPAVSVNNEIIQRGYPLEFETLPCPPPGVDVMVVSTDNCPEGYAEEDYCLWVNVVPEQPHIARERLSIDHFYIKETIYAPPWPYVHEYTLPADEYNLVFNNPQRGFLHEYEVYAVSAEGIRSEKTIVNMRVPLPGDNSYHSSNDWQENR